MIKSAKRPAARLFRPARAQSLYQTYGQTFAGEIELIGVGWVVLGRAGCAEFTCKSSIVALAADVAQTAERSNPDETVNR